MVSKEDNYVNNFATPNLSKSFFPLNLIKITLKNVLCLTKLHIYILYLFPRQFFEIFLFLFF